MSDRWRSCGAPVGGVGEILSPIVCSMIVSMGRRLVVAERKVQEQPKKVWRRPQWRARNVRTHC